MTDLPYFDRIIDALDDQEISSLVGEHVHWGVWENEPFDLSAKGVKHAQENLLQKMASLANVEASSSIVDVGCGFGGTIQFLEDNFANLSLTGLNIDERQLHRAEATVSTINQCNWVYGDACNMPFPANSFDIVFAVECIFHFPNRRRFLEEAYRVLKPGGQLVFSDFVAESGRFFPLATAYLRSNRHLKKTYGTFTRPYQLKHYLRDFQNIGFGNTNHIDVTNATLPTYEVIRRNTSRFDDWNVFAKANLCLEKLARNGHLRYQVIGTQKFTNSAGKQSHPQH